MILFTVLFENFNINNTTKMKHMCVDECVCLCARAPVCVVATSSALLTSQIKNLHK
jgi:hypothetical protein